MEDYLSFAKLTPKKKDTVVAESFCFECLDDK